MNRLETVAAIGLLTWVASSASAQQRPDFSGTWTRAVDSAGTAAAVAATGDAAFRRGDMGSGWGSPLTIAQQASRLTVEYPVFSAYDLQPPLQLAFALDGSASSNALMIGHATVDLRSTTAWVEGALVISTTYPGPKGPDGRVIPAQISQSLRLASPTTLVIEATRAGILGAATTTTRTTYTKP
jgi:hypothetical protein